MSTNQATENMNTNRIHHKSDFVAEAWLDRLCPSTPDYSSSSEEEDGSGGRTHGTSQVEDNLMDDHLVIPRSELSNPYQLGGSNKDDKAMDSLKDIHPTIINSCVQASISTTFNNATHDVKILLDGAKLQLDRAQWDAPQLSYPGLSGFAHTLPTVKCHLGLSTTDFIT